MKTIIRILAVGFLAAAATGCAGTRPAVDEVAMVPLTRLQAEQQLVQKRETQLRKAIRAAQLWRTEARKLRDQILGSAKSGK